MEPRDTGPRPTRQAVLDAVRRAWERRPEHTVAWPDPHPDGGPEDDAEYSRVTEPERYRIVGARAGSWIEALVALGLARSEPQPDGVVRLVPVADGALPLEVGVRAALEDVPGTGVDLRVGDPAAVVASRPHCGCDACDDGSARLLEEIDDAFTGILGGGFVLVEDAAPEPGDAVPESDDRVRIVATANGWSSSGSLPDPAAVVAAARRGERRPGARTLVGAAWWR
jgi:hypothetical protein